MIGESAGIWQMVVLPAYRWTMPSVVYFPGTPKGRTVLTLAWVSTVMLVDFVVTGNVLVVMTEVVGAMLGLIELLTIKLQDSEYEKDYEPDFEEEGAMLQLLAWHFVMLSIALYFSIWLWLE